MLTFVVPENIKELERQQVALIALLLDPSLSKKDKKIFTDALRQVREQLEHIG